MASTPPAQRGGDGERPPRHHKQGHTLGRAGQRVVTVYHPGEDGSQAITKCLQMQRGLTIQISGSVLEINK